MRTEYSTEVLIADAREAVRLDPMKAETAAMLHDVLDRCEALVAELDVAQAQVVRVTDERTVYRNAQISTENEMNRLAAVVAEVQAALDQHEIDRYRHHYMSADRCVDTIAKAVGR